MSINAMYWHWKKAGMLLAACFLAAIILVKPIGVSTQYVIFDGILFSLIDKDLITKDANNNRYSSTNAYLDKSGGKYAKSIANPINYSFIFVISMIAGGFIASKSQTKQAPQLPLFHQATINQSLRYRYLMSFIGGILVLLGARLAGGCTSGHMMSGMMQTAMSGYIFTIAVFLAAVPTAILLYKRGAQPS